MFIQTININISKEHHVMRLFTKPVNHNQHQNVDQMMTHPSCLHSENQNRIMKTQMYAHPAMEI